jgi:hypothetical protein
MRLCLLTLSCALALPAGVIQGVTLEWASGKPLSRTNVHLQPVAGSGRNGKPLQTRTGRSGEFSFPSVPDGLYVLQTQREGFLPAGHAQRRPTGHGTPISVSKDSALFTELRLHRMGAVTGTVFDENGVGIPRVPVVAYRARLPLRIVSQGTTDDRGIYRLTGLELGKYWVRTSATLLDDGSGLLPLFSPESREPRDALLHEVRFDNDTTDANIRPEPGSLATLSGNVVCDQKSTVTITISSETMSKKVEAQCGGGYTISALAPAFYEISTTYADGSGSGFAELQISQNVQLGLQVISTQPVNFDIRNAATRAPMKVPVKLFARRDDLSGAGPVKEVPLPSAPLAAGHWEFTAAVGPGQYVASIQTGGRDSRRPWRAVRPPEGFPIFLEPFRHGDRVQILVSDRAGQLSGIVTNDAKPAPGMPVFLWPEKEEIRRILGGPRQTMTDINGHFQFTGLPPGDYRVLATMDIREITAEAAEESNAKRLALSEGQTANVELTAWLAP